MSNGKQIAQTILEQLGNGRFITMTGAKQFHHGENFLQFKIGRNNTRCNFVKIALEPSDTYTVKFYYMSIKDFKELKSYSDVYCDNLQEIFTEYTGLYTSLGSMGSR